ncbi:MAG TPA: hypothetical protein VFY27_03010 [Woeseiaceae bacterium]|nr:hypothetical protein [Woeseiaceae bacterium]
MFRRCLAIAIFVALPGCVPFPVEPPISAAQNNLTGTDGLAGVTGPIKTVNIRLGDQTRCENVTRTGSRIVVAQRCYSKQDEIDREERTAQQVEQARRDQDELDRRARDLEDQRRQRM